MAFTCILNENGKVLIARVNEIIGRKKNDKDNSNNRKKFTTS